MAGDKNTFSLSSSSSEFSDRSNDIFGSLNALEAQHKQYEEDHASEAIVQNDPDEEACKTITSSFKKPRAAPKRTHAQSVQKFDNTHKNVKWTHYSLADVGDDDLSDSANKKAAFDFLHQQKKLKENEDRREVVNVSENACSKSKFKFGITKLHPMQDSISEAKTSDCKTVRTDINLGVDSGIDDESGDLSGLSDATSETVSENVVFKKSHRKHQKLRERPADDEDDDCTEGPNQSLLETKLKQKNRSTCTVGRPKEKNVSERDFRETADEEYMEASEVLSDEELYNEDNLEDDTEYGF